MSAIRGLNGLPIEVPPLPFLTHLRHRPASHVAVAKPYSAPMYSAPTKALLCFAQRIPASREVRKSHEPQIAYGLVKTGDSADDRR
jgi:hypothetical protein